jgi:hypothetical protein
MLRRKIELCGDAPQAAMQSCKTAGVLGAYMQATGSGPVPAGARPKRKIPGSSGWRPPEITSCGHFETNRFQPALLKAWPAAKGGTRAARIQQLLRYLC